VRTVAGCMRARGRYSNSRERVATIRVRLGVIVLALPALFLSLTLTRSDTVTDPTSSSDPSSSHHNITDMVVLYVCMACVGGPTYFTTYHHASVHYARSACNQSQRGIATVVLPNRPADTDAGGSGGAGVWAGPGNATGRQRQRPGSGSAGARHFIHVT